MVDREPEIFRREIIVEKFFETSEVGAHRRAAKVPPDARRLVNKWKGEERTKRNVQKKRHNSSAEDITEFVEISMGPGVKDGQPGYSVRKEIVYPYTEEN